jgi:energy-coupling factor transporter ATP-binding protein EcfA2
MEEKSSENKGRSFENRVGHLFKLLGFVVKQDELIGGRQVDMIIEDSSGPLSRTYLVECKNQATPVTTAQYDSFSGRLRVGRQELGLKTRGIIVASVGFVKEAKRQGQLDDIELISFSELETSVIDFRQYIDDTVKRLGNDQSMAYFIEPKLKREQLEIPDRAFQIIDEWLRDLQLNQLTLLGDYGAGKSTLLKALTLSLARRYQETVLEGGAKGRVPIFIDLKEYTQAISLKQIILDFLDTHSIKYSAYAAFEYVLNEGQILLVLDGFDEMASRGNYKVTLRNFREMNKYASGRAKIILSCRTHYFTTDQDVQKFHGGPPTTKFLPKTYTDLYREIATRRNFLITYLTELEPAQIEEYLKNRCGEDWHPIKSFIDQTYNLPELSRKPVLLDMIVSSQANISSRKNRITPGLLYEVYTDIWLSRNDWSTIIDLPTKSLLLERFAYQASLQNDYQLHFKKIPELIRTWNNKLSEVDSEEIDRELRTASFLVRDTDGNYRFSHKSFQEFFYSKHLLTEAGDGKSDCWKQYFKSEIYHFVRDLITIPDSPGRSIIRILCDWAINDDMADIVRINAIKCLGGVKLEIIRETMMSILRSRKNVALLRSAATALANYPQEDVVDLLIETALNSNDNYLLSNCLLALVRLNNNKANQFVVSVLKRKEQRINLKSLMFFPLFIAAKNLSDKEIINDYIRNAPIRGRRPTLHACLDLCSTHWTIEAEEYCLKVLEVTNSPEIAAKAFQLVSMSHKLKFLKRIFGIISASPRDHTIDLLIKALSGLKEQLVKDYLVNLMENPFYIHGQAVFEVLCADYPQAVIEMAKKWIDKRRIYTFRIKIAEEYSKLKPADGFIFLKSFLTKEQRVIVKISILMLIQKYYPQDIVSTILDLWVQEPTVGVKRFALELLVKYDREKALFLMLERGLNEARTGVRVDVCAVLAAFDSSDASDALLQVLQNDNSKWVRAQALKSLCSPGRTISKEEILKALATETDLDVLRLKGELIRS